MVALSVLDLSPVTTAIPPAAALNNTLDLARFADRLGFTRYWLAEHHNLPTIASSAPDIMIGQVAAVTANMRIGSGGVMLPNHAPLMVMERFKVLEALVPGPDRSRAGPRARHGPDHLAGAAAAAGHVERAGRFPRPLPGDDAVREQRLPGEPPVLESGRHADRRAAAADLAARLQRLFGRAGRGGRRGILVCAPLLGLSARRADAELPHPVQALGLATEPLTRSSASRRSAPTRRPRRTGWQRARTCISCAARSGQYGPLASPEEAAAYPYTPIDRQRMAHNRKRLIVGSAAQVKERIDALVAATQGR